MASQDLHQVILRWPHNDANEVIVTGTFDKWACSLRLARNPDGFEAPPVFIPWRHKMAYKFIVDGRWMTNDAEPTEVDHGFINNVYTAPPAPPKPTVLPEPEPSTAPPSYHSESEVEHEPAEKVAATNGIAVIRETPTPTADVAPAPEQQHPRVPDNESESVPAVEAAREAVAAAPTAAIEATQAAYAQVAPAPADVAKAAEEITSEPGAFAAPEQIPIPEIAPKVENATPAAAVDDQERSTHVPLRYASSSTVVAQVEEPTLAPESVPQIEVTAPSLIVEDEEPERTIPVVIEEEESEEPVPVLVEEEEPEETRPVLVEDEEPEEVAPVLVEEEEPEEVAPVLVEAEEPEEPAPVLVEEEVPQEHTHGLVEETEAPAPEPAPAPTPAPLTEPEPVPVPVPATVEEPVSAPPQEPEVVAVPATEELAPASEPAPEPTPVPEPKAEVAAVQVPAAEPTVVAAPEPTPTAVVEAAVPKAPATEPTPVAAPVSSINGHSKNASTSTAAPSLPSTPTRKASRKFSFPGRGKDKSPNSSPTGSTRFASQQKRDKRHSLLGKLKEIFSDKSKKEKSEAKAA